MQNISKFGLAFILVASLAGFCVSNPDIKSTRVVGGRLARQNEVPYIVSIQGDSGNGIWKHLCGGSIFNERFIITAAHCVEGQTDLTVIAGATDYTKTEGAQVSKMKSVALHAGYGGTRKVMNNDIAVLKLAKPLTFNAGVQPIPIAPAGTVSSGKAIVSGWGRIYGYKKGGDKKQTSEKLMTTDLRVVPKDECDKQYREIKKEELYTPELIEELKWRNVSLIGMEVPSSTILCAGSTEGKSACKNDSGGPLQCSGKINGKAQKYLCGIVVYGYGCGTVLPGAYTDAVQYHDWILENINRLTTD